jgi:glycosyltransferase involved in cell wall biosynthesis
MNNRIKIFRITTVPESLYLLLKGQLSYMNRFFEITGISSKGAMLEEVEKSEGIRVHPVNMTRSLTPLKDLVALWKLCRFFFRGKPSIVHTHTPKAGTLGMIAAFICRVPVRMHTVAGLPLLEVKGPKRLLLDIVERITCACATGVYPNSMGLMNIIVKNRFCRPEKLKLLGNGSSNGINLEFFSPGKVKKERAENIKKEISAGDNEFIFIFIGRLVKDKGINELVRAFVSLNCLYEKTRLLLIGNFEADLDPLEGQTVTMIKNNPAIFHAGYQSDIRPYLTISNVLVFPSHREGFPNVPIQGLAMRVPAIVTDINGCNEIVSDEYNGLIINPKDEESIFQAMERLLNDRSLYMFLVSNTRSSIEKYDQGTLWEKIRSEYLEQLAISGILNHSGTVDENNY